MDQVDRLLERAKANIKAAGIPVTDSELEGMRGKGFLERVSDFENYIGQIATDVVPDYLGAWDAEHDQVDAVSPTSTPSSLPTGHLFGAPDGDIADEIRYGSISTISASLKRREISSYELTHLAIERISDRDPILNAFQAVLAERALKAARRADSEMDAGIDLGPLHGVPIAAKDLLAMRGTITTAGSAILAGWKTDFDADSVEKLEEAGAVIVGKTRMSEFAFSPGSNNAHYGPTRNPWNLEHDTGGSSSGSGAAVADGMVYGALGSDTGGSIRMPGALCGVVGHKPTFGRISLHGAVTLSWSLDHLGPMTRTVGDAALIMNVLAGYDPRDIRTRRVPVTDYTAGLGSGVRGVRIGVLTEDGSGNRLATEETMDSWHRSLRILRDQGAELIDIAMPELEGLRVTNGAIVAIEAAAFHEPNLVSQFEHYGEFMRQRVLSAYAYNPNIMARVNQARAVLRQRADKVWDKIDVLSTPGMPYEAPALGDPSRNTTFTGPFNSLGWPAIVVPVSLSGNRLPLSTQIVGKPWDDALVLRVGAALEAGRGTIRQG
jgi:Asp-tRNA(Asn)/Glu-tRNA(Gln) amidotransferase A subunit family amidase